MTHLCRICKPVEYQLNVWHHHDDRTEVEIILIMSDVAYSNLA